ncbi:TPA: exotoxin, partial [Streptococcus pyogenes]
MWVFISAIIPTCYAYEMSSVGVINLRNLYSTYDPTEVKGK